MVRVCERWLRLICDIVEQLYSTLMDKLQEANIWFPFFFVANESNLRGYLSLSPGNLVVVSCVLCVILQMKR